MEGEVLLVSSLAHAAQERTKDMWATTDQSRLASLGLPRSLYLTPVDHIVSGWGQMQGAPSFGPGKRGGPARCNRSIVRSPLQLGQTRRGGK